MTERMFRFAVQGRPVSGWRLWVGVVAGMALLALLAAFALVVFLVLFPIVAAVTGWQMWKMRRAMRKAGADVRSDIIDAEYVVVERPPERLRKP